MENKYMVIRKRISFIAEDKKGLEMLELGHWLSEGIKTPFEVLELLKRFGMPKTSQIALDGRLEKAQVTIKKRHIRAREKVKKDRHEELTKKVEGVKEFVSFLKKYDLLNDQVDVVDSREEAAAVIEFFKKRISPKGGKK